VVVVAVALVPSAWTIATGLSVGIVFVPAAFSSAGPAETAPRTTLT
jgi:hypothetical protein